ncbi:protein kinase [Streptomyces acidiscabies]|uniref:Protein kinase n=1 Tax=Streptomyces acidiscabies TaxID=42234 RepID=A0AAP6BGI5_9ACTN|nr:protein kinase [Streptomyces acidiscabies]MBP5937479.1 protein kinase [Streptomyces sp. LBUM 1476]MBZ3914438.1 protein kinase [Streptomyces acidiscabies]MDX2964306.1 protein kinase [Streptomyces acidiscabies]MDX3017127.1 protein kinase [Streptomyces acidiscabies]MDX3789078.1 protein kinase [Streptomyces acidiscabies]
MDDYAGRVLADRYRLPLPPSEAYELSETRAFDTYSGQEVLVRQVPLPEVVEAEVLDAEGLPEGFTARERAYGAGASTRRPADPVVRRALEAAQAAARIPDHPRLDQVFDVFAEGGSLWIVSELVGARPLAELLAEKPLTPYRAAEVASDVLMALRVLHAHGWVHRNITARTVLVCDDGRIVLTGLAVGAAEEALCGNDPVPTEDGPLPRTVSVPPLGDGGTDPEAARRAAIEARAAGRLPGGATGNGGTFGNGTAAAPAGELAPPTAPSETGGDIRAARAGAIAAYRAGARAAARVQEAEQNGKALESGRAPENGRTVLPGARGEGSHGQIADPYGVREAQGLAGSYGSREAQGLAGPYGAGGAQGFGGSHGARETPDVASPYGIRDPRTPRPESTQAPVTPTRWSDLAAGTPSAAPAVEQADTARLGHTVPQQPTPTSAPTTALAAERARQARMAVVGPVTERWAPEQAGPVHENWQLAAPIGPATDLWALGALLFRSVQGHAPYPEESTAELVQMVCGEPPAFAEECGPLRPVVESLLRQDPTERPDFEELRGWLRSLVRSAPEAEAGAYVVTAPPADPRRLPIIRRKGELVRRRKAKAKAAAGGAHARHKRGRAEPERSPRNLGRTLLVIVLLLLAGAIAYAVFFMPKASEEGAANSPSSSAGATEPAGATASPPPASSEPRPDQSTPGGDETTAGTSTQAGSDVADGFTLRADDAGFKVAVADGWERSPKNGRGQVVYSHGDFELIVVPGRDSAAANGSDPMAYQRDKESELEPYRQSSWATASGLRNIQVGQQKMAEGQFTWTSDGGQELFVRNRAVLIAGRYHVVQVRGPEAERDEVTRLYEQAAESYRYTG